MKTMSLCAAIFALLVFATPMPPEYAIGLWVAACGWALLMWAESDEQAARGNCPEPIKNERAWPPGVARGFNAAVEMMRKPNKEPK